MSILVDIKHPHATFTNPHGGQSVITFGKISFAIIEVQPVLQQAIILRIIMVTAAGYLNIIVTVAVYINDNGVGIFTSCIRLKNWFLLLYKAAIFLLQV